MLCQNLNCYLHEQIFHVVFYVMRLVLAHFRERFFIDIQINGFTKVFVSLKF
jgi:hypothetical protein